MTYLRKFAGSAAVLALLAGVAHAGNADKSEGEVAGMANATKSAGTIVDGAAASETHTTLVTAVKAADLVETLSGPGPFTVFAPTDDAFAALPDGTVETLLMPENREALTDVLTYHVIAGDVSAADLKGAIEANGGEATLTTVAGAELTARATDGGIQIVDAKGNAATVTAADIDQSNGTIHVIDTVLLPG